MGEKISIKRRLRNGEVVIGPFVKFNSPAIVEMLAYSGFDFMIIDGEHSSYSYPDMENLIRTANGAGMDTVVRVQSHFEEHVLHAADMGAQGVQIPSVTTVDEAEEAAKAMRYYPNGNRGFALTQRAAKYTFMTKDEYLKYATDDVLCVVHVENLEMAAKVEELCKIPQIDVLFIGPGDLSQAVGKPGEMHCPEVLELIGDITKTALANGKMVGIFCGTIEDIKNYSALGIQYMAFGSDLTMIASKFKAVSNDLKEVRG